MHPLYDVSPATPFECARPSATPHAAPEHLALLGVVGAALALDAQEGNEFRPPHPVEVRACRSSSNMVTEIGCSDGRSVIVKLGRYRWDRERFAASRLAATLLRRRTGVIAPRHLDAPDVFAGQALEAYWRIELPTLRERWPSLSATERTRALRSWGALLRRVHKVRLAGHGPLERAARQAYPLERFLSDELRTRLPPSVDASWPAARRSLRKLASFVPEIASRVGRRPGVLLHNDPHYGNVLCEPYRRSFRCGGVLDLEAAMAGPLESDLAHVQVLHGPLFGEPLAGSWFDELLAGYGARLDDMVLVFFRAYHLLNLGIHAALTGLAAHAAEVADAAEEETRLLRCAPRGRTITSTLSVGDRPDCITPRQSGRAC